MKSVLLSIHPEWCELIASGKKTVEIRRTRPKIETPFKCYIYCTLEGCKEFFKDTLGGDVAKWNKGKWADKKGKVIGEFICDEISGGYLIHPMGDFEQKQTCLTYDEIEKYSKGKPVISWHISDLVIYENAKELSEFFVYCERCDKRPIACEYSFEESNESGYYSECMCDFKRPIKRPPQSWCYVEEREE